MMQVDLEDACGVHTSVFNDKESLSRSILFRVFDNLGRFDIIIQHALAIDGFPVGIRSI